MEIDRNSTTNIDSLIKSYPSLQRLPNKDRVREKTMHKKMKFFFVFCFGRLNVVGLNMKCQLVLMLLKNILMEKNINNY
jgi:hypothetical protein